MYSPGHIFSLEMKWCFDGQGNLKNGPLAEDHDFCCSVLVPLKNQQILITRWTDQIMTLPQQQPNKAEPCMDRRQLEMVLLATDIDRDQREMVLWTIGSDRGHRRVPSDTMPGAPLPVEVLPGTLKNQHPEITYFRSTTNFDGPRSQKCKTPHKNSS